MRIPCSDQDLLRVEILLDSTACPGCVGNRKWLAFDALVQFPEVVDEPCGAIFLRNDKRRCSPFRVVSLLEDSNKIPPVVPPPS